MISSETVSSLKRSIEEVSLVEEDSDLSEAQQKPNFEFTEDNLNLVLMLRSGLEACKSATRVLSLSSELLIALSDILQYLHGPGLASKGKRRH